MVLLRAPLRSEAERLSDLCLRSKATWGYDAEFLQACRLELTISVDAIVRHLVQVAEVNGSAAGVVELSLNGEEAALEKLFVDPAHLRSGVGRLLFCWARNRAQEAGASVLTIDSDPQAVPFYLQMGSALAGSAPSGSIPGRVLPRLLLPLRR